MNKSKNRMMSIIVVLIALGTIFALSGCGDDKAGQEDAEAGAAMRTVEDYARRTVEIPDKVDSVVCIGVGALRYTCYMGAEDLVTGVEDYEHEKTISRPYNYVNYELFEELPVIGVKDEPDPELLLEADPDVIIMSAAAKADADELQKTTGIPVVVVPNSDGMIDEAAYETFRIMGDVYGREERAEELTEYMDEVKEDLRKRTSDVPDEEKPGVYVAGVSYKGAHGFEGTEAGYGPLAAINARNLADETGQEGAFDIDTEQVLAWDPDVIFVDFNGMQLIEDHYERTPDYYEQLTAVREGRVYSQISYRSSAANLETALADAYYAGTVLYPEQFSDIDSAEKADEIFDELLGTEFYETLKGEGYEFKEITIGQE